MLVVLALLSAHSRGSYDEMRSPQRLGHQEVTSLEGIPTEPTESRPSRSAAALPKGLRDPDFWHDANSSRRLTRLQVGGSLAVLALLLDHTATSAVAEEGPPIALPAARTAVLVLAGLVLVSVSRCIVP